jgi:hypothetical protein
MDTRIPPKTADVREVRSTARVTPGPAQTHFKEVLAQTAVQGAEQAMTMLPGGPVMALALRGAPALPMQMSGSAPTSTALTMGGLSGAGTRPISATANASAEGPSATMGASGAGGGSIDPATGVSTGDQSGIQSSLQQSQEMNLYYLQIQETVNAQNRSFTALSNVIKAEHDTVKTAIGNIH